MKEKKMASHRRNPFRKAVGTCILATISMNVFAVDVPARPNVVFVITDDQGYGDLACHGNPIVKTPELDRLYAESLRFTDYHVGPSCAPSRGAIMSGHWTNRAGTWHTIKGRSMLFEREKTLGDVFSEGGYATGLFGKWHLGANYPFRPEDRGFQEVVRHGGGGIGQTPDYWNNGYFDDMYFHNGVPERYKGYCTDVFFREARRFIRESVKKKKPFFAFISTNAPHGPLICPEKYSKLYPGKKANLFGMISNIDENVGALRRWLREQGLAENTIFIFTTDNGSAGGTEVYDAGMRGKKGSEYDGGHRVPFFMHWPNGGIVKGNDMARICAHVDLLPTLAELCGLPLPPNYKLDGRSLAPLIRNPKAAWPERVLFTDNQRVRDPIKWRKSSAMTERWRLINGTELYDIKADPDQSDDIAANHPEVVERLRAAYDDWWADVSQGFSHQARIVVGNPAENPSVLTAHDWAAESTPPHNQKMIRDGKTKAFGPWAIHVETPGRYRISLMRWPPEAHTPINAKLPTGAPSQGSGKPYRQTAGKAISARTAHLQIGDTRLSKPVKPDAIAVAFDIELAKGDADLQTMFTLRNGDQMGAYYAVVEKL